jgi:tellurite resistance protein TerC
VADSIGTPTLWAGFALLVTCFLAVDLGVVHRKAHTVRFREALTLTAAWVALAMIFNAFIYYRFGSAKALEFLTGYLIEEALSVDNVFVFLVTFSYFSVPPRLQYRVLFWGIIGALVMRLVFILVGVALLERFAWLMFVFGGILIVSGFRLLSRPPEHAHPERNLVLRLFCRLMPTTSDYRGARFFVREGGRIVATPLAVVLVAIEASDLMFAMDSIPAIFAVTTDPLIIYTSNAFAILGLRSMFFVLSDVLLRFERLNVGLALVLVFVGAKMLVAEWFPIPVAVSLVVVASLIGASVLWSVIPRGGVASPTSLPRAREVSDSSRAHTACRRRA